MKIKLNSQLQVLEAIAKLNALLDLPDSNGTETYCNVPELTDVKDENDVVVESYYELEITADLAQLIVEKFSTDFEVSEKLNIEIPKRYKVEGTKENYLQLMEAMPEMGMYRKQKNIAIDYIGDNVIFYLTTLLPEHEVILKQFLGANAITDRELC